LPTVTTRAVDTASSRGNTAVESQFDAALRASPDRTAEAIDQLRARLADRDIRFGEDALPTSIKPHFIRRSDNDSWTAALAQFLTAVETTSHELRRDPGFRCAELFSRDAWELLDIDPGYRRSGVVCRPDVIWEGHRIGLLELNADSPAMMLYADEVQDLQRELFPMREVDREGVLTFDRRIPVLLQALIETYREWGGTEETPTIAVVDWPGQKTGSEQAHLARLFTAAGYPSFVCHPHELELRGGRLYGRGERIDIVQRRLLFPEVVARKQELGPFLTAYRERTVCVINPLRSYLVGCKGVLAEVCKRRNTFPEPTRAVIDRVLPLTHNIDDIDAVDLHDRARWVLKPAFGSGGTGVQIGRYTDEASWERAVATARAGRWIAQTYLPIPLYRVPLTSAPAGGADLPLYANWNPFFFGGRPAGGIARVSREPVVGISARGALLPSVIVNDE
jgi:glutathionylspermidine synthase